METIKKEKNILTITENKKDIIYMRNTMTMIIAMQEKAIEHRHVAYTCLSVLSEIVGYVRYLSADLFAPMCALKICIDIPKEILKVLILTF
jgi:hypothetical protein